MARSFLSSLGGLALALTVATLGAAQEDRDEELTFESGPLTFDRQANLIEMSAPRIVQGDSVIAADEARATGIDVEEAAEWRLLGNVRFEVGSAVIEAARAVFTLAGGRLSRGQLDGAPVLFSAVDDQQRRITGNAQQMSYDYSTRTLRMMGEAWIQLDNREIIGCDLIYDFAAERVSSGSSECGFRFRQRRPEGQSGDAAGAASADAPAQRPAPPQ